MEVKIDGTDENLQEIKRVQDLLNEASKILYHIAAHPVKLTANSDREVNEQEIDEIDEAVLKFIHQEKNEHFHQ